MKSCIIEEISLNQWQPLQTMLYDGWVLRFADGYTKRANSINPIYNSKEDPDEKIKECERIYSSQNLSTIFRISPFVQPPNLDHILEQRGYSLIDSTSIQVLDLNHIKVPVIHTVKIEPHVNDEWLESFCALNHVNASHMKTMHRMLDNRMLNKGFITLLDHHRVVACGLGIIERKFIGLFDVVTGIEYRNKGFGEQLLLNLLQWGKENGAEYSWLAVMLNNQPALHLYGKVGFKEIHKYWYRVRVEE
jgi:predicted GNAT family N-acyltransferase